jgi:DNA-binding response OmpR family regulator
VDDKLDSGTGVETIREICRHQSIPVIFITAQPDAVKATFLDAIVIPKPFSKTQIAAAIDAAVKAPLSV